MFIDNDGISKPTANRRAMLHGAPIRVKFFWRATINISFLTERSWPRRLEESKVPIVSGDLPREECIFHPRAATDVVHDQISLRWLVPNVYDYADMVCSQSQVPGDNVARQKVLAAGDTRERLPFAREVSHEVRHPSMIDV